MRVAIVGTGGVARRHLGVLRTLEDVSVVGHLSADPARAATQAAEWGGRGYADLLDLIEGAQPEAVWICVTPDRHGVLELELIQRGIPFFVEKPLAVDIATAEHIVAALQPGPLTGVGYKFRALDTLPRVRELLAEHPARLVVGMWHGSLPSPLWWRQANRSGGQVVEQATHLLDLARFLVGDAEVVAAGGGRWPRADAPGSDVDDVSASLLRFRTPYGSVPGTFTATSLLRGSAAVELQLVCEGRLLRITEGALFVDDGTAVQTFPTTQDPFLVEDRAFLDAVRRDDRDGVLCTYAEALQSHRLACAVRIAQHA